MRTIAFFLFMVCNFLFTLKNHANTDTLSGVRQNVSILFYNVENLYDPYNDTVTLDDDFTRGGKMNYTWSRFRSKLDHLSKTLITACGRDTLAFIGLCEVENRYVLNKLIYETPLKSYGYRILHHDSPDARGVDVAALYNPKKMKILYWTTYPVRFPQDPSIRTRDILYVKALLFGADTLHLFVNHWPSRRGGQAESAWRRNHAATMIRNLADSVFIQDSAPNILITGDFNDDPIDESLHIHLGAALSANDTSRLFNLTGMKGLKWNEGTIRYRGRWSTFDQFIVSGSLLTGSGGLVTAPGEVLICRFPFLLEEDPTWFGESLSRTYAGPRFLGGYSDHLPVLIRIRTIGPTD